MRRVFLAVLAVLSVLAAYTALPAHAASPAQVKAGWSIQHSDSTTTLRDVGCLSTTHCFAAGDAGTLLVTTDGGRAWHRQQLPRAVAAAPLFQLTCTAPATCYAIARPDIMLVTHDGGTVWTAHTLPVRVPGLTIPQAECPDGIVVQTGGYQPPNPPAGWVLCGLGLLDVSCVNAMDCYAVASNAAAYDVTGAASASAPPASIWLTEDGGATWTSQRIPYGVDCDGDCASTASYDYPLYWVSCAPGGPCWAGGENTVGSHEGFASALLTTPGPGKPWRMAGCAGGDSCVEQPTDFADCPVSGTCYQAEVANPFGAGTSVTRASAQVSVPMNVYALDIACPAAKSCTMVGLFGSITGTTNGKTFLTERSPVTSTLYGITCPSTSVCYAVGADGTILRDGQ
jgi:photosystem II stability/assembly factor-like uncharacterized protein